MICKFCGEDINEKGQDNISPISGYPICEDCKEDIMCAECCTGNYGDLYYVEECDKILCRDCLIELAEERRYIHTTKSYYTNEYSKLCDESNLEPIIDYLKENDYFRLQEIIPN